MKSKFVVSIVGMTISWLLMNIIYAIITAIQFGQTNESGVLLFWSGVYIAASWLVFVAFPLMFIGIDKIRKAKYLLPVLMLLYSALVYSFLLGKTFRFGEVYSFFLPYAALTGFIFGLAISIQVQHSNLSKYFLWAIPIIGIGFYLLFPTLLPSTAYRYMPDRMQDNIVSRIIPKVKVGDSYDSLIQKWPAIFSKRKGLRNLLTEASVEENKPERYYFTLGETNEFIEFQLTIEDGFVTEVKYKNKQ